MNHKIIVPIDSSPLSERTLIFALELAQNCGAELLILWLRPITMFYFGALGPEGQSIIMQKSCFLNNLNFHIKNTSIRPDSIKYKNAAGDPAGLIVSAAAEEKANLIVMSSYGFSPLIGLLFGNASQMVIKHAPCPVLIVK